MSKRICVLLRAIVLLAMAGVSSAAFGITRTWDAEGIDDNWSTAANWSGNTVPGAFDLASIVNPLDTVFIDVNVNIKTIRVENGATVTIQSGTTLTQAEDSVVDVGSTLVIEDGGTFQGVGTLHLTGILDIQGGMLLGAGPLIIYSGGEMKIGSTTTESLIARDTVNGGTITALSSSSQGIDFDATITNTGLIDFKNNHDNNPGSGSPVFQNNSGGVIRKSFGNGVVLINFPVNNAAGATIDVQTGDIALNDGGTASGQYSIASGSTLSLTGTFTMSGTPTVTGAGTFLIDAGATLNVGAGVNVNITSKVTVSSGGTITGAGDLHVSGDFTWSGGTISGGGLREVENTSVPTISCSTADCLLDGAALRLQASTTFSASSNEFVFSNGASLTIDPGKTLTITADGDFTSGVGGGSINHSGTIRKQTSSGTSTIGVPVTFSAATVDIDAGTLQFGGGASVGPAAATFDVALGTTLEVTGGVFNINSGSISYLGTGDFKVSSGTLLFSTGVHGILNLTLQGGIIDGAGDLHVNGNFNWLGGTIAGGGGRFLSGTSTPAISCSAGPCTLDAATLQMNASGTFNATSNSLIFSNSASFIIAGGKTLDITTDGTIVGTGTISNGGTITKSGGAGIRSIGTVLNNNGTVTVTSGGLSLLGNGTHSGSFTVTMLASMLFDGGTHTITGGISGAGTLAINGATVTLNSTANAGGFAMSGGALGGSGTLTLSNGGTWSGGTMSGSGTTAVADGETLTVSGFPTLNGRTLDLGVGAMLDVTSQRLEVSSAASVTGSGIVRVNGGTLRVLTGVTQTIPKLTLNAGVVDGAGDLHVSGPFNWSGGTISGSGEKVLTSTPVMPEISCSTGNCLLDGATLRFQAWGKYTASSNALVFSNGASLILDAGKVLFVENDGDFLNGGGAASSITVGGFASGLNACIQKTTTLGTTIIGVPVTLSGSLMTETGTMQVGAGVTVAAAGAIIHHDAGSTIEVTGGVFLFNTGSVFFPATGTFKVSGGTLRVPTGITLTARNLTLEGSGVIDGAGDLHVSGNFNWLGGKIADTELRVLDGSPQPDISCSTGNCLLDGATLRFQAWGKYTASSNALVFSNGASLILEAGNVLFVQNDGDFLNGGGAASSITVGGFASGQNACIQKTTTLGTTIIGVPVTLSGSLMTETGTMQVSAGVTVAAAGAIIHHDAGSTIEVTGGVFLFNTGSVFFPATGTFKVSGGTLRVPTGITLTARNLTLEGSGVVDGGGTLILTDAFTWSGGAIAGSSLRVLNSASAPAISCTSADCLLDGGTLQLQTSATTYSASSNALVLSNGASLILDPGKILFVTNDGDFVNGGGAASSITVGGFGSPGLNGAIEKTTTAGTSTIGVPVMLSGTFKIDTGTLQAGADVTVAAGANVHYAAGTTIEVTGGVFLFTSSAVTITQPGSFKVSAGTLRVPTGVTITMLNVTLQGSGVIDGGGTLNLSGSSTWSGGTMSGNGTTVIPATKSLGISAPVALGRTLQNNGTLTMSGDVTGSGTVDNGGTLNAAADLTLGVTVNNSGQIATSNALSLAGGGTHTGSFNVTAPGSLSFPAGTHTMSGGGSIGGTGTLTFNGATATVGVPVNVSALNVTAGTATLNANGSADAFTLTGGTLGGSGTLTLNNGGTWSGGTMSGNGTTINPATKTLGISAPVTLNSRTLQNAGTLTVSGDVNGSGTIDNGGTLNTVGDINIGVTVNNSGQVSTSNALSLAGSGTHTGSFDVTSPGILSFASGTHTMSGGGSITGTGTLTFDGATATVGVPVNVGALNVSAGMATLDANGSADAFAMTGGTLGGSGTLTLTNGGTWSGGSMSGSGSTVNPSAKTLSIPTPVTLSSRTLQNAGTLDVAGSVFGSGTIDNQGTLNAGATLTIGAALTNSGQVATSTLLLLSGNGAHSGTFTVTDPGVINFSGGTQTISGTLGGTGKLRFSGAAATVSGTWSGMPVDVTGGSVALDSDGTIPELALTGGTLTGSGDVTVSGPSTWSGGMIAGSGDFKFGTGATVTMPGTNPITLSRSLRNEGTINFTAASNGMLIDGVRLRNEGTFDIQSSQSIAATAGTPAFLNSGTLKKSSGEGVMQFGAPLSNSGLVRIESGAIQFGGAYAQSAGRTTVLASAKLQAATISLDGGSLTGDGTVAGTVANRATVAPGASPGTLTVSGDYVQSAGGTLEIQLNGTAPGTQYDRLLVSGSVTLGGTLDITTTNGFTPTAGNAFQILTFGSRAGNSTFDVMNGLGGLVPAFSANDLRLVSQVVVPVAADVAVSVSGPASTIAGTKGIYTVTISNSGPDPATNIAVTALASPGLTFSANSGACVGSFPCNIAALAPGQSVTIHSAWDIAPSATGSVQLTVNTSSAADPNASNNNDTAVTSIGTCPDITIVAPDEMTTGLNAEANVTGFGGAAYQWSIVNGTISRGDGTSGIEFIAGEPGTTTLTVNVTGGGCSLGATFDVTVNPRCIGTAMPTAPADGTVTADAVVDFAWSIVDDASGYRLWLQQDGAPAQNLGTALDTSRTRIIPPGVYQWYVETLFDGCASHESERQALTILPAQDCHTREAPQLSAPADGTLATSAAVAFNWNAVPQALEYELWLAPVGGVPTLIRTTSDTSYTAVVPPGRLAWYVRAVFAGCVPKESARRVFTYSPPPQCTSERPLLIAPLERERLTSPMSFEWTSVSGATSYELYVDGELAATTTSPHVSDIAAPRGERRWRVRARLGEGCGAVDSAESRLVVIAPPPSCTPLEAPVLSAPAQISSGIAGRLQWSFVPGATAYVLEISGDRRFPDESTSSFTVAAQQRPFTFTNQGTVPLARYARVHAVDTNCVQPGRGAFSPVAEVFVMPTAASATEGQGAALLSDPTDVPYTLSIAAELAGQSFTATPTAPWLSVTPASGIVPPGGQTLHAVAHTAGLPAGTSTSSVEITTTATATSGALKALATTPPVKRTISVNNIAGVTSTSKSTPPPDALIIPAVASVTNFVVRFDSDICVTNTSAQDMTYEVNFVPTGAGLSEGKKMTVPLKPGATMAAEDLVATWFGGQNAIGTLEIRPLTEIDTSTSSASVGGLANRATFASSRTFSTTAAEGTYGQYIPAVLYANFVAEGTTLSLQHIAQSDHYHTNLGLVEGSGEEVSLDVRIFDAAGTMLVSFEEHLKGGERRQLDSVLTKYGLALDDGRIEVEVTSEKGKVTAYASVIDNITKDSQLVPAVTLDHTAHSKWIVPGVVDRASDSGNWQTDVRIFNAGTEAADLTLDFYSMNGGPPATRTVRLIAGEVRQLNRLLSFFAIPGDAGALHISSAAPAQIVATAHTYQQTPGGTYGQFITAVTPAEAVAAGTRALQILQMEESPSFQSNIGFAEVSGKPVTLEVAVFRPDSTDPNLMEVKLEPNEFRQLNSLLASFGPGDRYNARISVRAVSGEGKAVAYGSLVDHTTGDPTYIPGQ